MAAIHLGDLVALALGATRDAAFLAADRGLGAARLEAIKHCIARSSDGLTIHSVAAQFHMTPRSVQRLFEAEGTTFSLSCSTSGSPARIACLTIRVARDGR